ncbi:MAG: DUF2069 domain-containing protein [Undibacterium sp.]|nr:DUF2069 domain-containing protein [Undibacterium sp.]
MTSKNIFHLLANISLITLIILLVAWEWFLAPYKVGGSLLVLKVVPLFFPLRGILKGDVYTMQWSSMFILFYFTEGVVRATGDAEFLSRVVAAVEISLCVIFFMSTVLYVRPYKQLAKAEKKAQQEKTS